MISTMLPFPSAGPTPDRPSYRTQNRPPHTPLRPTWACRACGQPWPCAESRLLLKAEYDRNQPALSIYLAGLMFEAMRDLYHLNPHDGPSPRQMFDRFVAWGPFRRPIVAPPSGAGIGGTVRSSRAEDELLLATNGPDESGRAADSGALPGQPGASP